MKDTPFNPDTYKVNPQALDGLTVAIVGTLSQLDRKQAEALVECAGGTITASISDKTDLLVAGENSGSACESMGHSLESHHRNYPYSSKGTTHNAFKAARERAIR